MYRGEGDDPPITTSGTGTAFFLQLDGTDYLITARHNLTDWDRVNDKPLATPSRRHSVDSMSNWTFE
jgi:hypothetical protein